MPTKTTDGKKSPENQNLEKPEVKNLNEDLKEELFLKKNTDSSNS